MATFTSLPAELLSNVAGALDIKELLSLSLVTREMRDIAQDVLYQDITLRPWGDPEQFPRVPKTTIRLIRTLLDRPDLAKKVRALELHTCTSRRLYSKEESYLEEKFSGGFCGDDEDTAALSEQCIKYLKSPQVSEDGSTSTEWHRMLQAYHQTAFAGVVLALLPRLETLKAYVWETNQNQISAVDPLFRLFGLQLVDDQVLNDPTILSTGQLPHVSQEVTLPSSLDARFHNVKYLFITGGNLTLLNLPFEKLEQLFVSLVEATDTNFDEDTHYGSVISNNTLQRKYPALSHLQVNSDWDALTMNGSPWAPTCNTMISRLIDNLSCVHLHTLGIFLSNSPREEVTWTRQIGTFNALVNSSSTLTNLEHLTIDYEEKFEPHYLYRISAVTTFTQFTQLKRLEVLQAALIDCEWRKGRTPIFTVLPSSLESLMIIQPNGKALEWIADLNKDLSPFPNLWDITLLCRPGGGGRSANWFLKNFYRFFPSGAELEFVSVYCETCPCDYHYGDQHDDDDEMGLDLLDPDVAEEDWMGLLFGNA